MSNREQLLRDVFFPVMLNYYDWKENPDHYIPGTNLAEFLDGVKRRYRVTPKEWKKLEPEMRQSIEDHRNL